MQNGSFWGAGGKRDKLHVEIPYPPFPVLFALNSQALSQRDTFTRLMINLKDVLTMTKCKLHIHNKYR